MNKIDIRVFVPYIKDLSNFNNVKILDNKIIKPIYITNNSVSFDRNTEAKGIRPVPDFLKECPEFIISQYFIWKNVKADFIGFMEYDKHFSFINKIFLENESGYIQERTISDAYLNRYNLNFKDNINHLNTYDIILPKRSKHNNSKNNQFDCYDDIILNTIKKISPNFIHENYNPNNLSISNTDCMFIMKYKHFMEYQDFLFSVINHLTNQKTIITSLFYNLMKYFYEYINYFILNYYISYLETKQPSTTIKYIQKTLIKIPDDLDNSINICYCIDELYVTPLSVSITSLLMNSQTNYTINIFLLCDKSKFANNILKNIKSLTKLRKNTYIHIINIDKKQFEDLHLTLYFTISIYFRLVIPSLLSFLDKVIYLDADTIIQNDIKLLYDIDLGNNYIGAVSDIDHNFHIKRLNLKQYCNSGMLLMNIKLLNYDNMLEKFFQIAKERRSNLRYPDQDILNIACQNKIKYLDLRWNLQYFRDIKYAHHNSHKDLKEYLNAWHTSNIIHYIGNRKPWSINPHNSNMQRLFMRYLKKVPFELKNFIIKKTAIRFLGIPIIQIAKKYEIVKPNIYIAYISILFIPICKFLSINYNKYQKKIVSFFKIPIFIYKEYINNSK